MSRPVLFDSFSAKTIILILFCLALVHPLRVSAEYSINNLLAVKYGQQSWLLQFSNDLLQEIPARLFRKNEKIMTGSLNIDQQLIELFTLNKNIKRHYTIKLNSDLKVSAVEKRTLTKLEKRYINALIVNDSHEERFETKGLETKDSETRQKCESQNCLATVAGPAPTPLRSIHSLRDVRPIIKGRCFDPAYHACGTNGYTTMCCSLSQSCLLPASPGKLGTCASSNPAPARQAARESLPHSSLARSTTPPLSEFESPVLQVALLKQKRQGVRSQSQQHSVRILTQELTDRNTALTDPVQADPAQTDTAQQANQWHPILCDYEFFTAARRASTISRASSSATTSGNFWRFFDSLKTFFVVS